MTQADGSRDFSVRRLAQRWWLPLLSIASLLTVTPAQAASRQARERAARKACLAGDYNKGASILSDLFVETKDANFIFNQGRCFEQNHRYEDAISRFQEYLRVSKNMSPEDKADTEKHIADCKALIAEQGTPQTTSAAASAAMQVPPAQPVSAAPPQVMVATPLLVPAVHQTSALSTSEAGSGLRATGIVVTAVGGAALIAGVVLNLKVNSMTRDLQKNYDPGVDSTRKDYKTIGWIGYGMGATCCLPFQLWTLYIPSG